MNTEKCTDAGHRTTEFGFRKKRHWHRGTERPLRCLDGQICHKSSDLSISPKVWIFDNPTHPFLLLLIVLAILILSHLVTILVLLITCGGTIRHWHQQCTWYVRSSIFPDWSVVVYDLHFSDQEKEYFLAFLVALCFLPFLLLLQDPDGGSNGGWQENVHIMTERTSAAPDSSGTSEKL